MEKHFRRKTARFGTDRRWKMKKKSQQCGAWEAGRVVRPLPDFRTSRRAGVSGAK